MDFGMTIGGRSVPGSRRLAVENPAHAATFAHAPDASAADVRSAVAAAGEAFPGWSARPFQERADTLRACGALVHQHKEELAELLTREQGKPLAEARSETALAADWFGHTAALALLHVTVADEPGSLVTMERVPYGPVAAVAPSNFPLILAATKIAPALLAGNTVVFKPSEATPLSGLRMAELLAGMLPAGALNAVCGGAAAGAVLTEHPDVPMVSFTGSVPVGRAIARAVAPHLKHLVLELGGNDACLILPGADIDALAPKIFAGAMVNAGQFCAAIKRVYVSAPQAAQLTDALAELASAVRPGDGLLPGTDCGPLISRAQLDRATGLVDAARDAGARVVPGTATPDLPGHFLSPTVVTDLPPGTRLEAEEQFAPVLPVLSYGSVEEAVDRANGTEFGLGGSVWGDEQRAASVAAALDCGTVWINQHGALRPDAPFGGYRSSGMGSEYGYWGLLEYTRIKVRNTARTANSRTTDRIPGH
ncbi:aldehyde dehydrogenase family protein [Streptomyces sp. NPDC002790]|uniref:aldehyde dehydrogenase family protein n=1 Tax=Streptomyces sp. NPDC002790 TaxID=3154431 RepID=UPI0033192770